MGVVIAYRDLVGWDLVHVYKLDTIMCVGGAICHCLGY